MPEGAAAVFSWFSGASAAAGAGEAIAGATVADAVAAGGIVDATAAGYAGLDAIGAASLGGGASVAGGAAIGGTAAAAAAAAPTLVKTLGGAAINAGVSTAVGSLLAPKPPTLSAPIAPTTEPGATKTTVPMPDPVAQQAAEKRSLVEQLARRGRASTILTSPGGGGGGKLGG